MNISTYTGGSVQTNGYLVQTNDHSLVIDAPQGILSYLIAQDHTPTHLLLTHQHFDHVEDTSLFTTPTYAYEDYNPDLILDKRAQEWGLPINVPPFKISDLLKNQTQLTLGDLTIELLHVPGHSPDSIAYHFPSEGALFGGDALFAGGIGRTDLPHGNEQELLTSIREKLYALPEDTRVFPGHGPATTIGQEKRSNPFTRA